MSYIGAEPTTVAFLTDTFSGNGSTVAFTMSVAPATTTSILVAITGVVQDPSTYSVVGTTLTFSAAPPSGTGNISVRYMGIPASGVTTTAYRTVTEFTATAGQTTFSVPSYTVGYIDVYRNGSRLGTADFTATNGTTVVLAAAATAGDLIATESFYVSSVLNAIPATAGAVNSTYIAAGAVGNTQMAAGAARANFGAGAVLQVVSATKTDTFSSTSYNTWVDITGLSVSITPTSSSSKILIFADVSYGGTSVSTGLVLRCVRNSTAIGSADAAGNRTVGFMGTEEIDAQGIYQIATAGFNYLDSPATTSSTTYKIQVNLNDNYGAAVINRSGYDGDTIAFPRASSSITVMEIAG